MLISFSDRRYEIGLRKSMGATDPQIFIQFLLEALVLAALGASPARSPAAPSAAPCPTSSRRAWSSTRMGLAAAWATALLLAVVLRPLPRDPRLPPVADGGDAVARRGGLPAPRLLSLKGFVFRFT